MHPQPAVLPALAQSQKHSSSKTNGQRHSSNAAIPNVNSSQSIWEWPRETTAARRKFAGYGWHGGVVRSARSAGASAEYEVEWEGGSTRVDQAGRRAEVRSGRECWRGRGRGARARARAAAPEAASRRLLAHASWWRSRASTVRPR